MLDPLLKCAQRSSVAINGQQVPFPGRGLAADGVHGADGTFETVEIDLVTGFLGDERGADSLLNVGIGAAFADQFFEVVLVGGEQAGAQFAVCRHADAVAVVAERIADGGDDADLPLAVGERIFACRADLQ